MKRLETEILNFERIGLDQHDTQLFCFLVLMLFRKYSTLIVVIIEDGGSVVA